MSSQPEIDVHRELAGAAVTPLHKVLGVLITLITSSMDTIRSIRHRAAAE